RPAVALAAPLRLDVEVFQVDPVPAEPGRVAQKPQREPNGLAVFLGDMREQRWLTARPARLLRPGQERRAQVVLGRADLVPAPFVGCQLRAHLIDRRDVGRLGRADPAGRPTPAGAAASASSSAWPADPAGPTGIR